MKPFTHYICSVGGVGMGHKSMYTGANRDPSPHDEVCICGAAMIEEVSDGYEYRVVFESIDPFVAGEMQARNGRDIWKRLSDVEWAALPWRPPIISKDRGLAALTEQFKTLKLWAETHEQPIRNVQFQKRQDSEWLADPAREEIRKAE